MFSVDYAVDYIQPESFNLQSRECDTYDEALCSYLKVNTWCEVTPVGLHNGAKGSGFGDG